MPKTNSLPRYRLYKRTGNAVVTLDGRDFYLGTYGTAESRAEYERLLGEWMVTGRSLPAKSNKPSQGIAVVELVKRFFTEHVTRHYRHPDGMPTKEQPNSRLALRIVRELYGRSAAADFGPLALKAVRQRMIGDGGSRQYINKHVRRILLMFKRAVENELLPSSVYEALKCVSGLEKGRCDARETDPVRPVVDAHILAIRPYVNPQVWAMVELQRLTGMRSGEVTIMRASDIDIAGVEWNYRPASHKTAHHGHERAVPLGPKARAIIRQFLKVEAGAYLFSPSDAELDRRAAQHAARKIPIRQGNRPGSNRKKKPKRRPREYYSPDTYRIAIRRACKKASVPTWHPHQLRHTFATKVRKEFGIEPARILLGHRSMAVTELYAEIDRAKTRHVVERIG